MGSLKNRISALTGTSRDIGTGLIFVRKHRRYDNG